MVAADRSALRRVLLLCWLSNAVGQPGKPQQFVVELTHTDGVDPAAVLGVFEGMGVAASQASPLVAKVAEKGRAIVIAGPQENCEAASKRFEAVGMKATARPLSKADMPSEYSDSDVIEADEATFNELLQDQSGGTLVTFYAPWCGHCVKMVPEFKRAASMLKRSGIRTAAVNSDSAPNLARSLGIKGFPSVRWMYAGRMTDYAGPRTAVEMASFANQQALVSKVKRAVNGAITGTKLAMSKVLNRIGRRDAGGNAARNDAPAATEAAANEAHCSIDAADAPAAAAAA